MAEMQRVECGCHVCRGNNGGSPLAALVPPALAEKAKGAKGRHGLVYSANDPSVVGEAVRKQTGLRAG